MPIYPLVCSATDRYSLPMQKARIVLILVAFGFIGFGMFGLVAPLALVGAVDITAETAQGRTELRAVYGGLQLGLGVFLLMASSLRSWMRPALALTICSLLGLACARLLGIQMEGGAFPWMLPLAALELGLAVLSVWAWSACRHDLTG